MQAERNLKVALVTMRIKLLSCIGLGCTLCLFALPLEARAASKTSARPLATVSGSPHQLTLTESPKPGLAASVTCSNGGCECTWSAGLDATEPIDDVWNILFTGGINCNYSTSMSGQTTLYYDGPTGNLSENIAEGPHFDTTDYADYSNGTYEDGFPGWWQSQFIGGANAAPGYVWDNPPAGSDCYGGGQVFMTCDIVETAYLPPGP
jgi:hypothetical protein